ncbi:hypothetical protein [Plantactinospora sonchi]|uniref:Uncharacterized protein n=1 Tax=Plantactinospora sonchi TaxID=1544735 RepID=A0ABU7S2K9_9ACTN
MGTFWIVLAMVTVVVLGTGAAAIVAVRRRDSRLTPRERAQRAARQLRREQRNRRGQRARGTGDHFGKTKIKKYGDEHRHADGGADDGSPSYSDSGGGGSSSD